MELTENQQKQIQYHADRVAPDEACGYITRRGAVVPCENKAGEPTKAWRIGEPKFYQGRRQGTVTAIYHSHVLGGSDFSPEDIINANALKIPQILYYQPKPKFLYYDPSYTPPYIGREFHYAYQHCYSLICDWYRQELGIEMNRYYPEYEQIWEEPWYDPIAHMNPIEMGFVELNKDAEIKTHDVIRMRRSRASVHLGVISNAEMNWMLHQLMDMPSEQTVYGGDYRNTTTHIYRHSSLL